ncbi:hypothetical protein BC830DRAFT_208023 [Chytriomyces sp. MP71]|nr:hypothetical protein BC830DRAFT_208023 [Chytriomyces sp. MP71]
MCLQLKVQRESNLCFSETNERRKSNFIKCPFRLNSQKLDVRRYERQIGLEVFRTYRRWKTTNAHDLRIHPFPKSSKRSQTCRCARAVRPVIVIDGIGMRTLRLLKYAFVARKRRSAGPQPAGRLLHLFPVKDNNIRMHFGCEFRLNQRRTCEALAAAPRFTVGVLVMVSSAASIVWPLSTQRGRVAKEPHCCTNGSISSFLPRPPSSLPLHPFLFQQITFFGMRNA